MSDTKEARLTRSWVTNAPAWTRAVREGRIASRRAGTDAAVLGACEALAPANLLDVGCGEGWLVHALCARGIDAHGVDASAPLIEAARAGEGAHAGNGARAGEAARAARFACHSYDDLIARPALLAGPWTVIVCNFALLGDPLAPLLKALASRLVDEGVLLIQTVHPWTAAGDDYRCGWREERFEAFGEGFAAPMPWYFRTLESWFDELGAAGLHVTSLQEPRSTSLHSIHDSASERPLSLLLTCKTTSSR